jgi:hypothetical protein
MNPGSFLMNEDALARLEAGLRAQREKLGTVLPSPTLSPANNDPIAQMQDKPDLQPPPPRGRIDRLFDWVVLAAGELKRHAQNPDPSGNAD